MNEEIYKRNELKIQQRQRPPYNSEMFQEVFHDHTITVYREKRTDVMYMQVHKSSFETIYGGLTVMINTNGTPLTYTQWLSIPTSNANP